MRRPCMCMRDEGTPRVAVCGRPVAHVVVVAQRNSAGRLVPRPVTCCAMCLQQVAESAGRAGTFVGAVGWSPAPDIDVVNDMAPGSVERMGGPKAGDRVRLVDGRVVTFNEGSAGRTTSMALWNRLTFAWCIVLRVDDRTHITYVAPSFLGDAAPNEWQEQFTRSARREALARAITREG